MYDPKCYQLASDFLEDHPSKDIEPNRRALAQRIQNEIEEIIELLPEITKTDASNLNTVASASDTAKP